jgi:G3E family GTPase
MDEAGEQIAFADVILLNKTDLVSGADLDRIESRIRSMNAAAKIFRTKDATLPLDQVLDVGAFDLNRALSVDDKFLEPEYPFEWAGVFKLRRGTYRLTLEPGPDATMNLALLPTRSPDSAGLAEQVETAVRVYANDEVDLAPRGPAIRPGDTCHRLKLDGASLEFALEIPADGAYALFSEHHPEEFAMQVVAAAVRAERIFKPDHEHDEAIQSVGIADPRALDPQKFNAWIGALLREKGADFFRMKGVLNIAGEDRRYVFQGVHMLFDAGPERRWGTGARYNRLIFIGRKLDRAALEAGFRSCLV